MIHRLKLLAVASAFALIGGCTGALDGLDPNRGEQPIPRGLQAKMKSKQMTAAAPILIRTFKEEAVLEVWKARPSGRYALLKTYDICKYSGGLGPKFKEGDRQAPEGFYVINRHRLNPNSKYYLSINTGFPNAYDRSHGRTGSNLMIHGACSSAGCYSMTDPSALEIYALARDAFRGGQKKLQIQAFPFRMTPVNMARHADNEHFEFWRTLKRGHDSFELTKRPPQVDVCGRNYVFDMAPVGPDGTRRKAVRLAADKACPPMGVQPDFANSFMAKMKKDELAFERALAKLQKRKPLPIPDVTFASAFPGAKLIAAAPPKVPATVKPAELKEASKKIEDAAAETSAAKAD